MRHAAHSKIWRNFKGRVRAFLLIRVKSNKESLEEREMRECEAMSSLTKVVSRAQRKDFSGARRDRVSRKVCRPSIRDEILKCPRRNYYKV